MKTFLTPSNRRGVALVIVLAMLVLLSSVLIAFMLSAANERTSAQASSAQVMTRQVADSTLNLVLAQIRDATNQPKDGVTWSSQPGAIRTYGGTVSSSKKQLPAAGGPSGAYYYNYTSSSDDYVYKLYSADHLRPTASEYNGKDELQAEVDVIQNWDPKKPATDYVDLNQPILSARLDLDATGQTVEPHYPIIDPRAHYDVNEKEVATAAGGVVDGFDAKITKDASLKLANPAGGNSLGNVPYVPMPVKWLYVLKDGTIGSSSLATATNPIIGRTAFWADDESCKINVNTASEGTFWDTPVVSTEQESGQIDGGNPGNLTSSSKSLSFAGSQPARFEYQRYPGHPATTCLSPVLGWLWGLPASDVATPANLLPQDAAYKAFKEAIYQITAFTPNGAGTSKGATGNSDPGDNKPAPKLSVQTKHLFATVDEMMFKSQRLVTATGKSAPNANLTPAAMEKARFFLSANSRAPELNLYGRPRVTIWPIHDNPDLRTPFDDLFAFTSTISEANNKRFNLTRLDAKSDQTDYTAQNQKMYSYLRKLTSQDVPGFGGNFEHKYSLNGIDIGERDQILTEIFDYIRTVNLVDTGTASRSTNIFIPYTPKFYRPGYQESYGRGARSVDWSGQVTPLKITINVITTAGLGRFATISEAALVWHRTGTAVAGKQPTMQAVLVFEMATPMAGYPCLRETYWTKVNVNPTTAKKMMVTVGSGSQMDAELCANPKGPLVNVVNVPGHEVGDGRAFMPQMGCVNGWHYFPEHKAPTDPTATADPDADPNRNQTWYVGGDKSKVGIKQFKNNDPMSIGDSRPGEVGGYKRQVNGAGLGTVTIYPYVTKQIPVAAADADFNFTGTDLDVEIWAGEAPDDKRSVLVQTVHLSFPDSPKKMPLPFTNGLVSFADRFDGSLDNHNTDWITNNDIVRSIELTCATVKPGGAALSDAQKGDLRLAMARTDVPQGFFSPRDGPTSYGDVKIKVLHGLLGGHGDPVFGHTGAGYLVKNGTVGGKPPNIPKVVTLNTGVARSDNGPGDWDRGLSKHTDGPMANKVDEGNVRFDYANGTLAYKLPYFHGRNVEETGQTFFTPNRQLPSAVMFGSLPTGVMANKPWQTLLFRPDRETSGGHPGAKLPEDHLFLDLFSLPVVEPYAISEPFSTAGKVNMNFVIAPFGYAKGGAGKVGTTQKDRSYIRRDTALRGVLKSTYMLCVPQAYPQAGHAELPTDQGTDTSTNILRHAINLDKTIEGMEARLNDQGVDLASRPMTLFRSASEICDVDLYPLDLTLGGTWGDFWENYGQTGDNMRERPYATIYPRLTTKSNVFTVHMRCQAIKQAPGNVGKGFDPVKDQVVGEYRGSSIIERFIDPNDENLAKYNETTDKVDAYYRYRIVATKQFAPR